ncbi:MAG: hypothetical protein Q9178_005485 [Gyalolechia marmorata]
MEADRGEQNEPKPDFQDPGYRPTVTQYASVILHLVRQLYSFADRMKGTKFRTTDTVYVSVAGSRALEGPYRIATVSTATQPPQYTLSQENGEMVYDGRSMQESALQRA